MSRLQTLRAGRRRVAVDPVDGGRITSLRDRWRRAARRGRHRRDRARVVRDGPVGRAHPRRCAARRRVSSTGCRPTGPTRMPATAWSWTARGTWLECLRVTRLRIRCDLDSRWPFPGHVVQEFRLAADHLAQRVEVHAHGAAFPATVGWHPWFRRVLESGAVAELDFERRGHAGPRRRGDPQRRGRGGAPGAVGRLLHRGPVADDHHLAGRGAPCGSAPMPSSRSSTTSSTRRSAWSPSRGPRTARTPRPDMVAPGAPLVVVDRWAWG